MSIGMDQFGSNGTFATFDPFLRSPRRAVIFTLQCDRCGFEPDNVITLPRQCPKCHGDKWERFVRPGSILENADRD